jgi:hypothetical protein
MYLHIPDHEKQVYVGTGNQTPQNIQPDALCKQCTLWQHTPAPFGGLRDWGPCHLTKENFRRRDRVRVTPRWRKDTGEDTLSLGRTRHSVCDAVDVKGNFLGTHS